MPDEPDPPRKVYQLGKTEFKRVNATPENPRAEAPDQDVQSHLRDNLARAHATGLNELKPQVRRASRRKRDFWTLLILGNGCFGTAFAYFGMRSIPGLFALAGMVFYTCALVWVMWLVMDDY